MYYNQSCAAKGEQEQRRHHYAHQHGGQHPRHLRMRSIQRALVNIYKTDNSYEMLVFAPGRIKENFQLKVTGNELLISYQPPADFPRSEWILREYSRGGFERTFALDENIEVTKISAKYEDGVLKVSLPVIAGKEAAVSQEIKVS